jgi:pSer/pThr/pTyr-binding forkhead associated (FHA) protein
MLTDSELTEYLDEIRRQVCSQCVDRPPGGPPCGPLGKPCGIEMHLPQLIEAIHAVRGDTIAPYVENIHRHLCATCPQKDGAHCPCPMDFLAVLVVDAVEAVDRRHDPDAAAPSQGAERERRIAAARVTLTVEGGRYDGKEYTFDSRTTCLAGRALGCHVRFGDDPLDRAISRYHCLLDIDPPVVRVQDLGSRNGTYVNGTLIGRRLPQPATGDAPAKGCTEYVLNEGDKVSLGFVVLRVHVAAGEETPDTIPATVRSAALGG